MERGTKPTYISNIFTSVSEGGGGLVPIESSCNVCDQRKKTASSALIAVLSDFANLL